VDSLQIDGRGSAFSRPISVLPPEAFINDEFPRKTHPIRPVANQAIHLPPLHKPCANQTDFTLPPVCHDKRTRTASQVHTMSKFLKYLHPAPNSGTVSRTSGPSLVFDSNKKRSYNKATFRISSRSLQLVVFNTSRQPVIEVRAMC
jgi:hypothetical protein